MRDGERTGRSPTAARRSWRTWCCATWLAICGSPPSAAAQPRAQFVLVEPDDTLLRAVRSALEPWNLAVVVVSGPSPGAAAPRAIEAAREIARNHAAAAVAWLSIQEGRCARGDAAAFDAAAVRQCECGSGRAVDQDLAAAQHDCARGGALWGIHESQRARCIRDTARDATSGARERPAFRARRQRRTALRDSSRLAMVVTDGRIDEDGYVYITGRVKELYKLDNGK
jgi:hypothetical protein